MTCPAPNDGEHNLEKRVGHVDERVLAPSGASASSAAHREPVAELKNGKVVFRQKPVLLDKASETMQEIVKFREMLDSRVQNQEQPLASIPEEHGPLIVKLAHESDKGIVSLAKWIRSTLLPGPNDVEHAHRSNLESNLPLSAIEHTIKMLMTRVNYGLDRPLGQKLPAAVCVWRWEVQDPYKDWLPKSAREKAEERLAERIQARTDLRATFENLSQVEQDAVLGPKSSNKLPVKDTNKAELSTVSANDDAIPLKDDTPKDAPTSVTESEPPFEILAPKGRTKKVVDPEKAAKIKDKEEKRAAKVEKEKKQKEAQDRSRSIMANFFEKAKPSIRDSPTDSNASPGPSVDNEFRKTFRPFVLKKEAQLAPYNWFLEPNRKPSHRMTGVTHEEAIVIDDDTPVRGSAEPGMLSDEIVVSTPLGDSAASLREFTRELRQSGLKFLQRTGKVPSLKTYNPHSVRDTMSQLNDAEIAGDPTQVRHLLSILRDRQVFPVKVLIFHEDSRPGYYGTWTRNSRLVGPRTPIERDPLACDYGYDSGEEWEEEGPDDADDVVDDGDDDEPDAEDADSDLDSWLVDDEEICPPLNLDDLSPPPLDLSVSPPKRKAESSEKRPDKKRKVVVPLVPYAKGPLWESHIGYCEYDPFSVYRMQLLNDTPYPIEPFTFESIVSIEGQNIQADPPSLGMIQPLTGTTLPSTSKRTISSAPKTVFPEAYLSTLLAKITDLATPSFTFLVDSIYRELRGDNIKKNAIEAKVREISEKSKDKKVWVVKQAVQGLHQTT